jgi:hypothetical protein
MRGGYCDSGVVVAAGSVEADVDHEGDDQTVNDAVCAHFDDVQFVEEVREI